MDILDIFWTFYLNHLSPLWDYFLYHKFMTAEQKFKQECIPVGCIPPAAVVIMGGSGPDPPEFPPWVWAWI